VRARAPAKVNLSLAVIGKRPDGYHEIDTRMLALELADLLELVREPGGGVQVELSGPFASPDIPADGTNLAARAAKEVLRLARTADGIRLRLVKNIPSGSGLGGGSADAAAAWIAAATLFGLDPWSQAAESVLGSLGSDCVFFWKAANTGYARCLGRGERVEPEPAPASPRCVALVVPSLSCPTAKVYASFRGRSGLVNDLEPAALAAVPELRPWREGLDSCGASDWRLSGSGSAFFAPHDEFAAAGAELRRVEAALRERGLFPRGTWVARASGSGAQILQVV
jgi:4-diphosphocytidyl-2-C-methyl-D-erythritol kinase